MAKTSRIPTIAAFANAKRTLAALAMSFLSAALLSGCVAATKKDFSSDPNYSIGYNDGCATGNQRVTGFKDTIVRDEALFEQSDGYKAGWKSGYSTCGGNQYRDQDVFGGEDRWYESGTIGSTN